MYSIQTVAPNGCRPVEILTACEFIFIHDAPERLQGAIFTYAGLQIRLIVKMAWCVDNVRNIVGIDANGEHWALIVRYR